LNKIKLYNIRSYVNEELDFPSGSTLLWGNIGSGKSSILLAVDFALFGLQRGNLTGASLLRNGAEQGFVELSFSIGDKEYVLMRALKRSKSSVVQDFGYIIKDGVKEEKTAIELKQKVLELLNYPRELLTKNKALIFRYTVYTPQEEMKSILLGSQEERLDTLRKVFAVDKYKKIKDNSKIIASRIKETRKYYEGSILDLNEKVLEKEKLVKNIEEEELKLKELIPRIELFKEEVEKKKREVKIIEERKEEERKIKKEIELKQLDLKHLLVEKGKDTEKLEFLSKELEELDKEKLEQNEENEELKIKIKKLIPKIEQLKEENDKQKEEIILIEKKIEEQRKIKKEIELKQLDEKHLLVEKIKDQERLEFLSQEIEELEKDKLELDERILEKIDEKNIFLKEKEKDLRFVLNKIQVLKTRKIHSEHIGNKVLKLNNCPTCFQEVSQEYKQKVIDKSNKEVDEYHKEQNLFESKQKVLEEEISKLRIDLDGMKKKERDLKIVKIKILEKEKKNKEFGEIEKKIEENTLAINNINIQIKELQNKSKESIEEINNNLKDNLKIGEKAYREGEIEKHKFESFLKPLIKRLEEIAKGIEKKKKEYEEIKKRLEGVKFRVGEVNVKIMELQSQIGESIEEIYNKLKEDLVIIEKKYREVDIEKHKIESLLEPLNTRLEEISKEIEKKKEMKNKLEELNKKLFWLSDHFMPLMDKMEKNILFKVHYEFNSYFEKWFKILIDNESLQMRLDENYSPKIIQNGHDIDYVFLSGGEKTAGALAYRLALNQVVNSLNSGIKTRDLLILDEPTDGFSQEQLDRLKMLMEEIKIPQVIIVSHEPQIESFVDNIIKLEKFGHETKIT